MKAQLLVLLCLVVSLNSQVLGIDLGTEFLKAAIISPGKSFVIVENTRSERKTPNAISFIENRRLFQDQALGKKIRYPQFTYTDLNILLPLLDDPTLKVEYPHQYTIKENPTNRTIVFQIDGREVWLEQLYGMILKNIKTLASKQAGTEIKDVVLTVPGDWGLGARNTIMNAAHIGGFSVLSILRSNTAAALNYAMSRNDVQPLNVMFVNAGSFSLEISIAQFWGENDAKGKPIESVKILSYSTVSNVSGYIVDEAVAGILAKKFQAKHKIDLRANQRSWDTLLSKSSDVKETLSANKDVNVFIEGVHQGIDLHLQITRKEMEEASSFNHLLPIIESTLASAGLSKGEIASVELIGGVSRIPKLVSIVTDFFSPVEVGTHINGDECMALGAVLHAANMSITFKVKKIHLYDGWPFAISATIQSNSDQQLFSQQIFPAGAPNTDKKQVIVKLGDEESLVVKVTNENGDLKQFEIDSLRKWSQTFKRENLTKDPELVLTFASSSSEIVGLKGYVAVYVNETKVREITDYVKELLEEKEEEQEEEEDKEKEVERQQQPQQTPEVKEEPTEQPKEQPTEEPKEDAQQGSKSSEQTPDQKAPKKKKFKTVSVKKNLTYTQQKLTKFNVEISHANSKYRRYHQHQIHAYHQSIMRIYEEEEQRVKERAEVKNDLESKLYFLKNSFDEEFMKVFSTAEELESLRKVVEEKLEWLDENSYSGGTYDFKRELKALLRAANPIFNRSSEYQSRGKIVNETFEYLGIAYEKTQELNKTNYWLGEKIDELLLKINTTAKSIVGKLEQLKQQPLNEDPVVYNMDLFREAEKLREEYYALSIIPKPKRAKKPKVVEVEPEEEVKKEPEAADTENAGEGEL